MVSLCIYHHQLCRIKSPVKRWINSSNLLQIQNIQLILPCNISWTFLVEHFNKTLKGTLANKTLDSSIQISHNLMCKIINYTMTLLLKENGVLNFFSPPKISGQFWREGNKIFINQIELPQRINRWTTKPLRRLLKFLDQFTIQLKSKS